jgi:uncharacterized membrane protein (UPF0127 family)
MNRFRVKTLAVLAILGLSCCQGQPLPESPPEASNDGLYQLRIGDAEIYVEIVSTNAARMQGLMYRHSLPENHGMLFVYPLAEMRRFYMKNTHIPLSLAYIDEFGEIFQIIDLKPLDETPRQSAEPAMYVLEVNKGWFDKHGVDVGDAIEKLPSPEGAEW